VKVTGRYRPSAVLVADALLLALVMAGGLIAGQRYIRTFIAGGGQPQFYQTEFDAVVMEVCGRGFVRVLKPAGHPALYGFLTLQTDSFSCDQLDAGIVTAPPDTYQRVSRYFLESAGIIWRVAGISWHSLVLLGGLLFAVSAAAAYVLFRVGVSPPLAFLLTVLFASSAGQLQNLPHLRDYSKAPFVIAVIAAGGWIVSRPWRPATLRALAIAAGAIIGIGLGFRTDLLMMGLPVCLAIVMAAPAGDARSIRVKAEALTLFAAAFVLSAFPILRGYAAGNNIWHVIVLGLTNPFRAQLNISGTFYSVGPFYNDTYISTTINSYAERVLGATQFLDLASKEYEVASWRFFREVITTLPGDAMTRACAAITRVLALPADASIGPPSYVRSARLLSAYATRTSLFAGLVPAMPVLAAAALALLAGISLRVAAWWAFALFFFAGTPALQFDPRHFFHLEVLGWLALGFLVERFLRLLLPRAWRREHLRSIPARSGRALAFSAVAASAILGTVKVTRAIQDSSVRRMVERYRSADLQPIAISRDAGTGAMTADAAAVDPAMLAPRGPDVRTTYIVAEIDAACAFQSVPLQLKYSAVAPSVDFSITINVPVGNAATGAAYAYFPVYADGIGDHERPQFALERLTVPPPQSLCLRRLSRVQNLDAFPVLFYLTLTPDWQRKPAHETIRWRPAAVRTYVAPPDADVRRDAPRAQPAFGSTGDLEFKSAIASLTDAPGVRVEGTADAAFTYLLKTRYADRPEGSCVLIEGELRKGGFTAGLLENEQWAVQLPVTEKGRFRILLNPRTAGRFALVLANYLPDSKRTSFTIDRAVWLPPPAAAAAPAR
jgi:hypothetical protein